MCVDQGLLAWEIGLGGIGKASRVRLLHGGSPIRTGSSAAIGSPILEIPFSPHSAPSRFPCPAGNSNGFVVGLVVGSLGGLTLLAVARRVRHESAP